MSWAGAISLLVLVVWLVPIKIYRLPVALPFSLELYRLLMLLFVGAWIVGIVSGTRGVSAAGLGKPVVLLAAVGLLSILANAHSLSNAGLETQAIKSLSYFLSFLAAYVLVCSTLDSLPAIELVVRVLVLGAVAIAIAAVYESRRRYDVFDHLHKWFAFFEPTRAIKESARRGGRLRVRASAQHPIALGVALTMAMPLAAYLASRARSRAGQLLWAAAGLTVLVGALATVSRTIVLMAIAMVVVALLVRRTAVVRAWPALLVLVVAVHFAAPGAIKGIYHAFKPRGGLVHSQTARAGSAGSGRVADIAPGLRSWKQAPLLGHGLGTGKTRRSSDVGAITDPKTGSAIIFDDQYLNSLVSIGFLGLVGVLWFVWGAVARLVGTARRLARARERPRRRVRGRVRGVRRGDADLRRLLLRPVHAALLPDRRDRTAGPRTARMSGRRAMRTELGGDARTMARGAAANVGGALATTALSFALSLLITHELHARQFGLYSIALATVLLAQAPAVLGLDLGAVRFVALRASEGDEEGARASLQGAFGVVALTSTALTLVLLGSASWLAESFFRKPEAAHLIRLAVLALPALALTRVAVGGLQGLGVMRYSSLLNPARVAGEHRRRGAGARARLRRERSRRRLPRDAVGDPRARRRPRRPGAARRAPPGPPEPAPAAAAPLLAAADAHDDPAPDDPLDGHAPARAPAHRGRGRGLHDRAAAALARADDLDRDRADVRAADRGRGRARRPARARADAEAGDVLERLARDSGLRGAPAPAGTAPAPVRARRTRPARPRSPSSRPASSSTRPPARSAS